MKLGKGLLNQILALLLVAQMTFASFGEAVAQSKQQTPSNVNPKNSLTSGKYNGQDVLTKLYNAPNWTSFETAFNAEVSKTQTDAFLPRQRNFAEGFLAQHAIFVSAMAVNQLFFLVTSGDRKMFDEWVNSMTSLEFHSSMLAFTLTMDGYQHVLSSLFKADKSMPDQVWLANLRNLGLPLGNYVSSVFSDVYNNPVMQEIFATMDPRHQVVDPDNPNAGPTQNREVRAKVRRNLQLKLFKSLWKDFADPEKQFNKVFSSVQLGLVAYTTKQLGEKILSPGLGAAKTGGKKYFLTFVRRTSAGTELVLEKFLPAEVVDSLVNGAQITYLTSAGALKKWFSAAAGGVARNSLGRYLAFEYVGGVWGLVGFFIVNGILSTVVEPIKLSNERIRTVDQSLTQLSSAVNWYTHRKPGEEIPWSQMGTIKRKWLWINFFLSADVSKLQSDQKYYSDFWFGTVKPTALSGRNQMWDQIEETMGWFTETFLGNFQDEVSYEKCGGDTSCVRDWVFANAPNFQKTLTQFKADMYIRARVAKVSQDFTQYRNEVIFKDVLSKQQEWSTKINEELTEKQNKERYFLWIARGMSFNDSYFINNAGFWHPDLDSGDHVLTGNYFINDQAKRVLQFDSEVLKCKFYEYNNWCYNEAKKNPGLYVVPQGREADLYASHDFADGTALSNHAAIFKRFLELHRGEVNATSLNSIIAYQYPKTFDRDYRPREIDARRVYNLLLANPFQEVEAPGDQQELGVLLRWLMSKGLPDSAEYLARAGTAWDVSQGKEAFAKEQMCSQVTQPLLSLRPYPEGKQVDCYPRTDASPDADVNTRDFHREMADRTAQVMGLIYGVSGHPLDEATRDLIIAEKYTYDELLSQGQALEKKIADLSQEFNQVLMGEIYPGQGKNREYFANLVNEFLQKWVGPKARVFSENKDIFTQDGKDNARVWHAWQFVKEAYNSYVHPDENKDGYANFANVPSGALNNFDFEIRAYLSFMNQYAGGLKVDESYVDSNSDKKAFVDQAITIAHKIGVATNLVEMVWPQTPMAREEFSKVDQSAFKKLLGVTYQADVLLGSLLDSGALCSNVDVKGAFGGSVKDCLAAKSDERRAQLDIGKFLNIQDSKTSQIFFKDWPEVNATTELKNMAAGFKKIQRRRNESLDFLRADITTLVNKMNQHGSSQASVSEEQILPAELKTPNFLAPLLTATAGGSNNAMSLLEIFGQQIVQTENQKLIQARMACFMLGDQICSPLK